MADRVKIVAGFMKSIVEKGELKEPKYWATWVCYF